MRFCLRHSLKLQEVIDAAKAAMLDVAQEEMARGDQEISVSRLSIMTGVHRPDVTRLLENPEQNPSSDNSVARLIVQWQGDPKFCLPSGAPKILSLDGMKSEFAALVESVSSGLNPYTVLFELERISAVERTPTGLKLVMRDYVKNDDLRVAFNYLSRDCNDLIVAVEQNVLADSAKRNLHLQTEYDQVGITYLPQIRHWLRNEGDAFHKRARAFLSKFDKDLNPKINRFEPTARVSVCAFSRVDEEYKTNVQKPSLVRAKKRTAKK